MRGRRTAVLRRKAIGGHPPRARPSNRLLAALTAEECDRIFPELRTIPLRYRQVVQRQGQPATGVLFPGDGVTAITTLMRDGRAVEVGTVGNEGFIGVWAALGARLPAGDAIVQVPGGSAQLLPIDVFRSELERHGGLHRIVMQYVHAFLLSTMQISACNGLHTVEQRCCRWLLLAHDRVRRDEFRLTQESLAIMLGVRRPSVTEVARSLRERGLIEYRQGRMRIVNRRRLEAAACECYRVIRGYFEALPADASARRQSAADRRRS